VTISSMVKLRGRPTRCLPAASPSGFFELTEISS
jgi:hypothetical protein